LPALTRTDAFIVLCLSLQHRERWQIKKAILASGRP
jgi:hypothetical protein